jgi:hypothetical protein
MHEEYTMFDGIPTMVTLKAAMDAPIRNYRDIHDMALYLMMSGLERRDHLRACWSLTMSLEMMGDWDKALMYYRLLEEQDLVETPDRAAFMAACQAWVLHKMGHMATAKDLLDDLSRDLDVRIPDASKRGWVRKKIEQLIVQMSTSAPRSTFS